jgi:hypothetical protein
MNKIRCSLAAIVLMATLSGLFLQGSASLANAASIRNASAVSSSFVVGQVARSGHPRPLPPCPGSTTNDC